MTDENTDNPTISHKFSNYKMAAYPMSEEFIWLSGMISTIEDEKHKDRKQIPLSRLEVLHLIHNGFLAIFSPPQAKIYKVNLADDELMALLAEEYLDMDMKGKSD